MAMPDHETGTVRSGDVEIFYRRFGTRGGVPALIAHGTNYYDSHDWIEVGTALAKGREVVAFDCRGFGQSGWCPQKDYSQDANLSDVKALIDHLDWRKVGFIGHSRGGGIALFAASRLPERAAGLVLVDYCPSAAGAVRGGGGPARATVFPTTEAAIGAMSRDKQATTRERLDMILKPVDGGFVFRTRDPDFGNAGASPDMWAELAKVAAPTLIVRAIHGTNYTDEILERVRRDYPQVKLEDAESGHDVPGGAPRALIGGVGHFLSQLDRRAA